MSKYNLVPAKAEEKQTSDILVSLNEEQRTAVESINGPLLIIAGAGSGKTRVITHRIAYILEKGVPPDKILALTFTNKAAQEMKERIAHLVEPSLASRVWAGTFHSIFARILRMEADKIGFTNTFSIYDTDDSLSVVRTVMNNLGVNIQQLTPNNVRTRISSSKNKLVRATEFAKSAESPSEKILGQIFIEYDKTLRESNSMDFDDLLMNMIELLQFNKAILQKYQEKFKYILVDEYQDTNRAQYIAVNLLAKAHQNLCVVGDDAQSIYRWRGADIQNILDFQKDYPYSKTVKLERNYRSTKTIISAAESVIKHNRKQLQKKLWTENETGDLIDVFECQNEKEEALRVADIIKKHHKKGIKLGDMALLYRTNAQSLTLENSLRHANIPYIIVGGISFYKRKEIKDVVAYLRLIINPADNEAVNRVVNEPPRGLGQTSLKHIKYYASKNKLTLLQAFEKAKNITDLQPRAIKSCEEFAKLISKYIKKVKDSEPDEFVKELLEEAGYIGMYKEIETEESKDRLNNIEQLIIDIGDFFIENPEAKLEEYLQQISLSSDLDSKEFADEKLTMMTIHSAKGLEFKLVCVTGLEEGLFPLKRQDSHPEEEEEERRLFYVAITRAKEKLYLLYATNRARYGSYGTQSPSGFLREIDSKLLLWDGRQKVDRVMIKNPAFPARNVQIVKKPVNEYSQIHENDSYSQLPGNSGLRIGDRVRHSQFGPGKIVNISGAGMTQKADVNFDSIGRKSLLIQYAKLQKL